MAFKNPRKFDHYTSDVELEQRRALYRTRDYNWFLQARRGEIPGLPPMCRHWAERSFEVFLKDLGVKPDLPLTHRLTFEVAPDATEISPRTCRIAKQTPRRINRSTRRTLGMDQAVKAIESMQFTIATPERMRLQGHFGSQRPQDCKHPVTRKTITGPHTRLEPAKPDPQFTNPLWGKAAFTVDEYRRLIVPRLINFIDHLGHYIKPTGKTRYGMPIHAGWVPLTSEAHGYGKPEELNDAQWDAWRRALAKAFTAPTASPNGCFGGSVNMADFEALFNDNANGKSGKPGKARSKRLPFITTDKAGNPIYELGKFPEDQCWNLTKATDVEPGRIHMTLFGDLGDLTHAMRWNLIANYPSANVAMLERSEGGDEMMEQLELKEHQLPLPMQYEAQQRYLAMDGPANLDPDMDGALPGNAAGFAQFPASFGFPDPRDPTIRAMHDKWHAAFQAWRKARTKGQVVWPPPLKDAENLGLVERTPSGAIRYVYLPMRERHYKFHEGGSYDKGGKWRPRQVRWLLPPTLRIPFNSFLKKEVETYFRLNFIWQFFAHRQRDWNGRQALPEAVLDPLGPHYFHPVTFQAYELIRKYVRVQRNPTNPETGMPTYPNKKQRAYMAAKADEEARLAKIKASLNLDDQGFPPGWESLHHPQSDAARLIYTLRKREEHHAKAKSRREHRGGVTYIQGLILSLRERMEENRKRA